MPGYLPPGSPRAINPPKRPKSTAGNGVRPGSALFPGTTKPLPTFRGSQNVPVAGVNIGQINVPQIQKFLKSKGYDLPQTGQLDRTTRLALGDFLNPKDVGGALGAALQGTHIFGTRNPQAWNQRFGTSNTKGPEFRPNSGPGGSIGPKGNDITNQYVGPGGTVDLRGLGAIAQGLGAQENIPTSLATALANATANETYGPQIADAELALSRDPKQAGQNLFDINNWFGQVAGARKTAATRDTAISGAGISSMKDALAAIEASLGGTANQGTSNVANTGANDIGTLTALGGIQDQYNADLAPILALQEASAKSNQANKDALKQEADQQMLTDAKSQRGASYSKTYADTLMQILQQNHAYAQQGFQNKLAVQTAAEQAQLDGYKALQYAQKASAAPRNTFLSASPTDIQNVQNAVLKHILDANGNPLPGMTAAKAAAVARTVAGTFFPNSGVPMGWATQVVSPFFPNG